MTRFFKALPDPFVRAEKLKKEKWNFRQRLIVTLGIRILKLKKKARTKNERRGGERYESTNKWDFKKNNAWKGRTRPPKKRNHKKVDTQ